MYSEDTVLSPNAVENTPFSNIKLNLAVNDLYNEKSSINDNIPCKRPRISKYDLLTVLPTSGGSRQSEQKNASWVD